MFKCVSAHLLTHFPNFAYALFTSRTFVFECITPGAADTSVIQFTISAQAQSLNGNDDR